MVKKLKLKIGEFVYIPAFKESGTIEGFEVVSGVKFAIVYLPKTDRSVKVNTLCLQADNSKY